MLSWSKILICVTPTSWLRICLRCACSIGGGEYSTEVIILPRNRMGENFWDRSEPSIRSTKDREAKLGYSILYIFPKGKMAFYMRIKPTHTESDVGTEYLCVCVCVCEWDSRDIFLRGGKRKGRRNGRIRQPVCTDTLLRMYTARYVCTASSFSRRGDCFGYYLSAKAEKTRE